MTRGEPEAKRCQFALGDLFVLMFLFACASLAFRNLGLPATAMFCGLYCGALFGSRLSRKWYSALGVASMGAVGGAVIGTVLDYLFM